MSDNSINCEEVLVNMQTTLGSVLEQIKQVEKFCRKNRDNFTEKLLEQYNNEFVFCLQSIKLLSCNISDCLARIMTEADHQKSMISLHVNGCDIDTLLDFFLSKTYVNEEN